jgi:hypothetical protein
MGEWGDISIATATCYLVLVLLNVVKAQNFRKKRGLPQMPPWATELSKIVLAILFACTFIACLVVDYRLQKKARSDRSIFSPLHLFDAVEHNEFYVLISLIVVMVILGFALKISVD